jgi:hypothetical protein
VGSEICVGIPYVLAGGLRSRLCDDRDDLVILMEGQITVFQNGVKLPRSLPDGRGGKDPHAAVHGGCGWNEP